LRIGIIGCGNVLEAYAPECEKLARRGLAELILACGRESQRERALALGAPRFTTDAGELLENPDVDLVVILTSMPTHAELAGRALQAGKHVLVEKPLATSWTEARKLVHLAARHPGHLVCAPFTILSPTFQVLGQRLRRGDIGKPCSARARYGWSGPWWNESFYRADGGCLFDLGVYCVTSLTGLLGPVRRVTALTGVAVPRRKIHGRLMRVEAEDNAQVLLDFGQDCFAVVTTGFTLQQYRSPALEIYGTEGTLQMLGDDWDPDGYELWQNAAGAWQVFKETTPDWPWTDGLRHMVECIHEGKRPLVTPQHALHVLEILLKARQAGRSGKTLPLETTFNRLQFDFGQLPSQTQAHLLHDRTRKHVRS
jgi:predicted dehydrogenase